MTERSVNWLILLGAAIVTVLAMFGAGSLISYFFFSEPIPNYEKAYDACSIFGGTYYKTYDLCKVDNEFYKSKYVIKSIEELMTEKEGQKI